MKIYVITILLLVSFPSFSDSTVPGPDGITRFERTKPHVNTKKPATFITPIQIQPLQPAVVKPLKRMTNTKNVRPTDKTLNRFK